MSSRWRSWHQKAAGEETEFEEKVQARYEMERLPVWEADFEDLWP